MQSFSNDKFGNGQLYFTSMVDYEELRIIIHNYNKDKAVALVCYGLDDQIVKYYNDNVTSNDLCAYLHFRGYASISQHTTKHVSCYVIYNNSTCPKTFFGYIFSAFACIIVKHKQHNYLITVKDKTKKLRTLPGGTAEFTEVCVNGNVDFYSIAIRETFEETNILLKPKSLRVMAYLKFSSTYLQVANIPDYSQIMCVQASSVALGVEYLFDNSNKMGNDYSMKLPDNNEIEYVFAECLEKQKPKPSDLSSIAWFCAQTALLNEFHSATYSITTINTPFSFPPSLQEIRINYEPKAILTQQQCLTFKAMEKTAYELTVGNFLLDAADTPICAFLIQKKEADAIKFCKTSKKGCECFERDVLGFGPLHYAVANNCNAFLKHCMHMFDCQLASVHQLRPLHIAMICNNTKMIDILLPTSQDVTVKVKQQPREEAVQVCSISQFAQLCEVVLQVRTCPLKDNTLETKNAQNLLVEITAALFVAKVKREEEKKQGPAPQIMSTFKDFEVMFEKVPCANHIININYLVWCVATLQEREEIFEKAGEGDCWEVIISGDGIMEVKVCDVVVFKHDRVLLACENQ